MLEFARIVVIIFGLHFLFIASMSTIEMFKEFICSIKERDKFNAFSYSLSFWFCFFISIGLIYVLIIIITGGSF